MDIQQSILAYLSSVDDYESFDCDLLTRRYSRNLEEWTLFSLKAAAQGDLAKLNFGWTRMPPSERRWVLFAAAEANQLAVLEFIKDTDTQPVEVWRGGLYWASLKAHQEVRLEESSDVVRLEESSDVVRLEESSDEVTEFIRAQSLR